MQVYELGYLALPSIAESELSSVVAKLKTTISKAEGALLDGEAPFLQDLAYTMTKTVGASRYVVTEAYMGWFKFEMEPGKVVDLKDELERMNEVLRFLIIKAPKETGFTFAQAIRTQEEKEAKETEAAAVPSETEEAVVE